MTGQYLTAVFEIRPTRRKAAVMERARAGAEAVFWRVLSQMRATADEAAALADKAARRDALRAIEARLSSMTITEAKPLGLPEPVWQGLARDLKMAVGSYVELRAGGQEAEWPTPVEVMPDARALALAQFKTATTREQEGEARDALARVARVPGPRPLTIARARDARIIRQGPGGALAVVLNIVRAGEEAARPARLHAGLDATTGVALPAGTSRAKLVVPLSCSLWHEHRFLSGRAILRSSLVLRRGERWFLCAQFEMPEARLELSGARLGVDRGIVNPVSLAAVSAEGAVLSASAPLGAEVGRDIGRAEDRRRREQRRRGITTHRHAERVEHALHRLANRIVAEAATRRAEVVLEKLDGFKQTIVAARPKGARRGGWRRALKRAQLGRLEQLLAYKLKLAGLPAPRDVVPGGTSQTCPACSHRDPKNRPTQEVFQCTACGFAAHADRVGAVNIARRGLAMTRIKKGDRLAPLEQDMVARLRARDDGGLGPLAADDAARGFVADRAAVAKADDPLGGDTLAAGQKTIHGGQNTPRGVFAERAAALSGRAKRRKSSSDPGVDP